jgi:ATP-dependent Lhr-like helicase
MCTWAWRSLLAWRLARQVPNTFSLSVNDYGLELLAAKPVDVAAALADSASSAPRDLLADVLASLNRASWRSGAFARSRAWPGLVFTGYPGAPKSTRQLQASRACSTRSSASTTPATACWARPMPRCWRRNWTCATWPTSLAGLHLTWCELRAPSPFACR